MSDEPPILSVGTAVSAKYKGAFCEAKVSKVLPVLRYRVSYKEANMGTDTLKEELLRANGPIKVGRTVMAWHHGLKTFVEALVTRILDQSQYTVVFDDGDITTLRRNYLCLKSGRHFNESETLDQLPLTHPEHFSNPVVVGRSRRRNRNRGDDSDGEHEEADPALEGYSKDIGKVIMGDHTEKKRHQDWPPGLIMMPKNPKMLNTKEEYFIRSFKDDRFYNVPKKDVTEFNKEMMEKLEKSSNCTGLQKALKYLTTGELPANWEKHFFQSDRMENDPDLNQSESSDDEPCEEKDRFVAQLYKFLDEAGTPLNKTPTISGEDVDLYRLFRAVHKAGGYNKVSNHNKWKYVTSKMRLGNSQSVTNQIKQVYKKCLISFEGFYKTLGVTMLNHTKPNKKNKGRSLIRDKDRATPINSPKPDKDDEVQEEKVEDKEKIKKRPEIKEDKGKKDIEVSESGSDTTDHTEPSLSTGRPKRSTEVKSWVKEKKIPKIPKNLPGKNEEQKKDEEKGQQFTRSKSQLPKPIVTPKNITKENKEKDIKDKDKDKEKGQMLKKKIDDDKEKAKRVRKRSLNESTSSIENPAATNISLGDKLKVYYGPSIEAKITYEAKVVEIDNEGSNPLFLVHYTGWNTRYDEWIGAARVAENLSATTKVKRQKQGSTGSSGTSSTNKSTTPTMSSSKTAGKRRRGISVSRRTSVNELSRSTTPLSTTSNSSRPKTPATPATRSSTRTASRQEQKRNRRISVQTDTDTDTPASESEPELSRTRSGSKNEDSEIREIRTYKKRVPRMPSLSKTSSKAKEEDDDTEKEEEQFSERRNKKKTKRLTEKSADETDDEKISLPKGRDFDLNQIRSELKGFSKLSTLDNSDKESHFDDSEKPLIKLHITAEEDFEQKNSMEIKEEKDNSDDTPIKSLSCEDIYEFKEPEPFEFESRSTVIDDKSKKRLPRFFDDIEKVSSKSSSSFDVFDDLDKKSFESSNKSEIDDDEEKERKEIKKAKDEFDKLVESPSFNMGKSVDIKENKSEVSLKLFSESNENIDDCSGDMELSDTESQTQPIFARNEELFSDTFTKSSSEQNTLDEEFSKSISRNVDDVIQASIQRVIDQTSSTDDDTNDTTLQVTLPITSYKVKKLDNLQNTIKETDVDSSNTENSMFSILKRMSPVPAYTETTEVFNQKVDIEKKETTITTSSSIQVSVTTQNVSEQEIKEEIKDPDTKNVDKEEPFIMVETNEDSSPLKIDINKEEPETPVVIEPKKRKKIISQQFIESDSDSSDSDNLIIARSDDEFQTNSPADDDKDTKDAWECNTSQSIENNPEEKRNFKFTNIGEKEEKLKDDIELKAKDDEETENLHSMLLCEETIPRSPAPATETTVEEPVRNVKSALEMPFASVPGSNNKMILNTDPLKLHQQSVVHQEPPMNALNTKNDTPPSSPESTLSNLSPRDNNGGLSPDSRDIHNVNQSEDQEQNRDERLFSDDDSQMALELPRDNTENSSLLPSTSGRRQRTSFRNNEVPPNKRGRRPVNRLRQNSDSEEDTSDHSLFSGNIHTTISYNNRRSQISNTSQSKGTYSKSSRKERPLKYDFRVNLDGIVDSNARISMITKKINELKDVYFDIKQELTEVERKRKRIKRRQREGREKKKKEKKEQLKDKHDSVSTVLL